MKNETFIRGLSGAVYVALLLGAAQLPLLHKTLFIALGLIGLHEWLRMAQVQRRALLVATVGIGLMVLDQWLSIALSLTVALCCIPLLLYLGYMVFKPYQSPPYSKVRIWWVGLGYVVFPAWIIGQMPFGHTYNPGFVIGVYLLMWVNDTFAYLSGKQWGRHKLLERVSPKKTWEGFAGGLIAAIAVGIGLLPYLMGLSVLMSAVIAALAGVMGTWGDLVESKLKRECGVKDSGALMPGHGGALDRLDSLLFVAPFIYVLLHH